MRVVRRSLLAAMAAAAAAALPAVAHADLFQMDWAWKWSSGMLQHEAGLPDLDPSADRAFYEGAVGRYDFAVSYLDQGRGFRGQGGDITVHYEVLSDCEYPMFPCYRSRVTFDLGAVFAGEGDAATYSLTAWFPRSNAPWEPPTPGLDREWAYELNGSVTSSAGDVYIAMSEASPTTNTRVASPVPEPSTAALGVLGAALAFGAARRRRRGH